MKVIKKLPSATKEAILLCDLASFASMKPNRLNVYGKKGMSILHYVVKYSDDLALCDYCIKVIKVKAVVNTKKGKLTPLHMACIYGRIKIVKMLLGLPSIDLNVKDGNGDTPMALASKFNHLDIVLELVHLNALASTKNKKLWTPLHWACKNGNSMMVTIFIQLGLNPNNLTQNDENCLHLASESGCIKTVQIISQFVNPFKISENGTILHHGKDHIDILDHHLSTTQWKIFLKLPILLEINAPASVIIKHSANEINNFNFELILMYDRDDLIQESYFTGLIKFEDLNSLAQMTQKKRCEKMIKRLLRWQNVKKILFVYMFSMKTKTSIDLPLPLLKEICLYIN